KASKWFGEKAANVYFRFKPIAENADAAYKETRVKTVRKWSDLGAFDVFFTVITASIMYAFSRSVAKRTGRNVDEMMTLDPATPTPLDPIFHSSVSKLQGSETERPREKKFTDSISRREAAAAKPELYSQQVAAEAEQASLSPRT